MVYQAETEFLRLQNQWRLASDGASAPDVEALRLRYDIWVSRIGLLTNDTGVDSAGRRTIDVLAQDLPQAVPGAKLTTLFSPEHGISGAEDREGAEAR